MIEQQDYPGEGPEAYAFERESELRALNAKLLAALEGIFPPHGHLPGCVQPNGRATGWGQECGWLRCAKARDAIAEAKGEKPR